MATMEQIELRFDGRRARRKGAGRPRKLSGRSPHERRPELSDDIPVHVSLRVAPSVGRLRGHVGYRAVRRALATCIGRRNFRIVQASIQSNHIHLLVEADDKHALSNGLRAFMISAARNINRALGRLGRVFSTRYHATQLRTPRQVRNCLCYVLNNWRHHAEDTAGPAQRRASLDPYASGLTFDGWRDAPARFTIPPSYDPLPVAGPRTWLLTIGWRRHHALIGLREVPGG